MKLFRNELRKNFSLPFYIIYIVLFLYNIFSVLDSCVNNSVEYDASSFTFNFIYQFSFIMFIFIIINTVNIFSIDYKQYTWKNLLCTGTSKNKILLAKLTYSTIHSLLMQYIPFIISFILGILVFGFNSTNTASESLLLDLFIETSSSDSSSEILFSIMLSNTLITLFFISFILLIAELFRGSQHVLLLTMCMYVVSNMALTLLLTALYSESDFNIEKLLPFTYCSLIVRNLTFDELLFGSTILIIYTVLFLALSLLLFRKRDIPTSK